MKKLILIIFILLSIQVQAQFEKYEVGGNMPTDPYIYGNKKVKPTYTIYRNETDIDPITVKPTGYDDNYEIFWTVDDITPGYTQKQNNNVTDVFRSVFDANPSLITKDALGEGYYIFKDAYDPNPAHIIKTKSGYEIYRNLYDTDPMIMEKINNKEWLLYRNSKDIHPVIIKANLTK